MKRITIIVPIYNTEKYLEECINSIITQKYKDLEIILINDGSTDNSGKICEEYAKRDNRIKVIHQENKGLSNVRNCGIRHATGDWIMFVDSDDWIVEDSIEKIATKMDVHADVILLNHKQTEDDGQKHRKEDTMFCGDQKKDLQRTIFLDKNVKVSGAAMAGAKLYRREFLIKNQFKYEEELRLGEDSLLNFVAYQLADKVQYINYIMYNYRKNPESLSNKYNPNIIKDFTSLLEAYIRVLKEYNLDKKFEKEFNYFVIVIMNRFLKRYFGSHVNPKSREELKKELKTIIESEPYKTAIKKTNFRRSSIKRKILIMLLKLKRVDIILMLYRRYVK